MKVYPNAKINIGLFVTSKRADGYHNLETVFYPIEERDVLEIEGMEGKGECRLECDGFLLDCLPERNLVVQAYELLHADFRLPSVRVRLEKNIPSGAGLGGGSSDAAFMLKALNEYWGLRLTEPELCRYASRLGSDCAFFIRNKPAFAQGRGELLEELALSLEGYRILYVKPDCHISTREAYAGIRPKSAPFDLKLLSSLPVTVWKDYVFNDFEGVIFKHYPEVERAKKQMYEKGAVYASMSGSGSAVYGIFKEYYR